MSVFASLVGHLADLLQPLFHTGATAAAIILFTACVRLAVHPLSRASARGQKARTKLAPQIAELRRKHGKNPERMQKALQELHTKEKVSPLSGCLPSLLQMPAFFLMYHLFSSREIGGEPNGLLGHSLFAAPLGDRWTDALSDGGLFGGAGIVYVALFAIVAGCRHVHLPPDEAADGGQSDGDAGGTRRAARAGHGRDDEDDAADVLRDALHRRFRTAGRRAVRGDQHDLDGGRAVLPLPGHAGHGGAGRERGEWRVTVRGEWFAASVGQ